MKVNLGAYRELLGTYLRPEWRRVALLAVLIFSGIGLQLVNPQIIRYFLDTAQNNGATSQLFYAALFFLGSAFMLQIVQVSATYVGEDVGWRSTNELRGDLLSHCMHLDMSFHHERTPGEMIERIDGDVANLAIFFAQFVIRVVGSILLLIGVLVVLLWEDWRVSAALAVYAAISLGALLLLRKIAIPHWKATREASADLFGFLEEQLAGTEDVRSSGATPYVLRHLLRFNRVRLQKERIAGTINTIMVALWFTLLTLGQIIAFTSGYLLFGGGVVTIGTVYLIIYYTEAVFWPLRNLTEQIEHFQKAAASVQRLQELTRTQPQITDGLQTLPAGPLAVSFAGVGFGYQAAKEASGDGQEAIGKRSDIADKGQEIAEGLELVAAQLPIPETPLPIADSLSPVSETPLPIADGLSPVSDDLAPVSESPIPNPQSSTFFALNNISFELAPGKILGLLGRTGSGKTTITRLLFRLYDPQEGAVSLGDASCKMCDLREVGLDDLRRRVGIVTQDVQLFRASVRDNLTFFERDYVNDERILEVLDDLGLSSWLRSLPDGLDSELSSEGAGLSAGEAQLLAFARVFLKDPGLVILDEASSRLDPATENLIEHAVDRLVKGRTCIIIAHRLHTVHRADQIVILDNGRVAEQGDYTTLVNDPDSRFAHLLRTGLEEVLV